MLQRLRPSRLAALALILLVIGTTASASELCPDEQATEQLPPADPSYCADLDPIVRKPSALPLDQYERKLNKFISHFCHRRLNAGWKMDKTVRDAGPFVATLANGKWTGNEQATHMPVLIWYSPEMIVWLKKYRPAEGTATPPDKTPPIPNGAIMIKEMYNSTPAAACRVPDLLKLKPVEQGAAIMIRDNAASKDGWYWGWYGWPHVNSGWHVDYPPQGFGLPFQGFGQYCLNCHASARDNQTFASLSNIKGEPGTYLSFLSQGFYQAQNFGNQPLPKGPGPQMAVASQDLKILEESRVPTSTKLLTLQPSNPDFLAALHLAHLPAIGHDQAVNTFKMPSATYDNVFVPGHGPPQSHAFVTSDQCVGCHSAGGTGLQFEMTAPVPGTAVVDNFSPYGTWRTSPMGLAGRDPIFFTQLASETQTFHPPSLSPTVQNTCLGCHGIEGERQFNIDTAKPGAACPDFLRDMVDAIPYPVPTLQSHFGALARDGISCEACHHMVLGKADTAKFANQPQNRCVEQRQQFLNPDNKDFARTFTGSFFIGSPDTLFGPFDDPKQTPMNHALGIVPEHSQTITSSEVCGTCHTVHLPVFSGTQTVGYSYEQTTYPEWAFSAYRTGTSPDGKLPFGAGELAESCQGCHMPSADSSKTPFRSKIAGIQEHDNFPQVENGLPGTDIDLQVRSGFAKHLLVGLNVFFIEMAKQFNPVLGIPTTDPMLGSKGVGPLDLTEQTMLDQASNTSATISVGDLSMDATELRANVTVTNKTGHKFPSGVGFRRAFVDFVVLDAKGNVVWESGRTNAAGVLTDPKGQPIAGELWWKDDCSDQINSPGHNPHQPHYRVISQQDQVQIFQELVTTPPPNGPANCGRHSDPSGQLTTSFLSICGTLKDNRLLPQGFLPLDQRIQISHALGAGPDMAEDAGAVGTGDDPAYKTGGGDTFAYHVPLTGLSAPPAKVSATLYYQAIPPFFLQDRFCTAKGTDVDRLRFVTSQLKLSDTRAADWKLNMVSSGQVAVQ
ncbi:hypothetical protein [Acidisphaera sp. S103]|uniref:hypothetical protein n=1 Tax=Acidisphaera sp. S103 TaxID=1747223 RepID=UPI001C203836|nr:hypothetical protein [Acidisphaera sp. S103]